MKIYKNNMKHLKTFESYNFSNYDEPQVGDYVIAVNTNEISKTRHFLKNNIGLIISIDDNKYKIKYDDVPSYIPIRNNIWTCKREDILEFSDDMEDLEVALALD